MNTIIRNVYLVFGQFIVKIAWNGNYRCLNSREQVLWNLRRPPRFYGCSEERHEFLHQVFIEETATHFPAQPPYFAHSHGAQNFQQLVAPGAHQVGNTLCSPGGIDYGKTIDGLMIR